MSSPISKNTRLENSRTPYFMPSAPLIAQPTLPVTIGRPLKWCWLFRWTDAQQKLAHPGDGELCRLPELTELGVRDTASSKRDCGALTFWMTHHHRQLSKKPLTKPAEVGG